MDAVPLGRLLTGSVEVADTGLPVEQTIPALRDALAGAGHAVLHAPPGAGKTTLVPLRLLGEPWLAGGRIVMLEPRRLATRAAARRMASLLGEEVGATVGYVTRDDRVVGGRTRIEVVTEGILTRRLQSDPSLPGVGLVIFDEVHERNLQADLALAFVLDARAALRPELRLLAMSATLEVERLRVLLGGGGEPAPVVASEGRTFPIDVRWRPIDAGPRSGRDVMERATAAVVQEALLDSGGDAGDVLVFLPGAAEIRRVGDALRGSVPATVDVRPLYGALPVAEQDLALAPSVPGRRRVVLSTDIAETSLTVAGVHVVVDAGLARGPRYDARTGLTRLHTSTASRSSADQRAGRAGRTGPGVAYRLWSESDHATRARFAPAEILTVDLAGLLLDVTIWGTTPAALPFLDQPPARALEEAQTLLAHLGALDRSGRPTEVGRAMAELPLHPRLAHMVVAGHALGHGPLACALAALLEDRDLLRGRPDELTTDVVERVRLIVDRSARHPRASTHAVAFAQRRARDIARRAGIPAAGRGAGADVDVRASGLLLALAYPDRVAQARGGGRFRMRNGGGASVGSNDPLTGEPFLVVADLTSSTAGDARIRLAAALDAHDVEIATAADEEELATLRWDSGKNDLRVTVEHRVGALVLRSSTGAATAGPATVDALVDRVRSTRLAALRWTDAGRTLQTRAAFVHRTSGPPWPDLSDDGLLDTLDEWLAPMLVGATGRRDLERVDVLQALRARLGHRLATELDRVAPASLTLASGRVVPVDYAGEQPTAAVRVQDLFGSNVHPTVGAAHVPVVLELLSPAGRPIQITADLPGFWAGTWADVRKEMAGRYPKHAWPTDPASAPPVRLPRQQRR